jgi:hypothetical protein
LVIKFIQRFQWKSAGGKKNQIWFCVENGWRLSLENVDDAIVMAEKVTHMIMANRKRY